LSFLFHPERLSRLEEQRTQGGLGVDEMIEILVKQTFKANRLKGMAALIQQQNEQLLLGYMVWGSGNEQINMAARSALMNSLQQLKKFITEQLATTKDSQLKGHYLLSLERMKDPDKIKLMQRMIIPPGAPIGCSMD
jgi:hypothetical protein